MTCELVEHTADVAIRVRGRDLADLLAGLAWAVCDLLADAATVRPSVEVPVELRGDDREALVVALANELIFRRDADGLLLPALEIRATDGRSLSAIARGEPASDERHRLRAGLKAATWHELAVRDQPDGTIEALVVFDV